MATNTSSSRRRKAAVAGPSAVAGPVTRTYSDVEGGRVSTSQRTKADEWLSQAVDTLKFSGCGSMTTFQHRYSDLIAAIDIYRNILQASPPDATFYKEIKTSYEWAISTATQLANKIKMCKATQDATMFSVMSMTDEGISEPSLIGKDIQARIEKAITKPGCQYPKLADYIEGEAYRTYFKTHLLNSFIYSQFPNPLDSPKGASFILTGPAGTGKTMLAKAIAGELSDFGSTFINLSGYELNRLLAKFFQSGSTANGASAVIDAMFEECRRLMLKGRGMTRDGHKTYKPIVLLMDDINVLKPDLMEYLTVYLSGKNPTKKDMEGIVFIGTIRYDDWHATLQVNPKHKNQLGNLFKAFLHKVWVGPPTANGIRKLLMNCIKAEGRPRININQVDWNRKDFALLNTQGISFKYWQTKYLFYRKSTDLDSIRAFKDKPESTDATDADLANYLSKNTEDNEAAVVAWENVLRCAAKTKLKATPGTGFETDDVLRGILQNDQATADTFEGDSKGVESELDVLDAIAIVLAALNYTGSEIEMMWKEGWLKAQEQAIKFYNMDSENGGKGETRLSQKWILDRREVMKKGMELADGTCEKDTKVERFSFIPLFKTPTCPISTNPKDWAQWFTTEADQESKLTEEDLYGVFLNSEMCAGHIFTVKVADPYKEDPEDPHSKVFVVVTEREIMETKSIAEMLDRPEATEEDEEKSDLEAAKNRKFSFTLKRKQYAGGIIPKSQFKANGPVTAWKEIMRGTMRDQFVGTVPYIPEGRDKLPPDAMAVMFSACQFSMKKYMTPFLQLKNPYGNSVKPKANELAEDLKNNDFKTTLF